MNNRFHAMDENNGEGRMEKVTLSEATREKVEEATLAVFMEQYGAAMDAGVEIKMAECADMEFPPELDKRIQKLIANEQAKKRNKQRRKTALRALRSAAAVIMILLSVSSILFMTVEAFRLPVINFFVEKTERYWLLSETNDSNAIPEAYNPENPLEGIIPHDYELIELIGTVEESNLFAKYSNNDTSVMCLFVNQSVGYLQVDSEDARVTPKKLNGHDAYTYAEGEFIHVVWLDENVSKVFSIYANNVAEEALVDYAEAVARRVD